LCAPFCSKHVTKTSSKNVFGRKMFKEATISKFWLNYVRGGGEILSKKYRYLILKENLNKM
jgi:hypothetical protein